MKSINIFTITLLFLLLSIVGYAQTVQDLMSEAKVLENTASKSLDKANDIMNEQQMSFFSSLQFFSEYLLGQIQKEVLGDLTRQLNRTETNLLHEIRMLNNTIERQGQNIQTQIENLSLALENSVARVPFAKKTPTPIFYKLPIIATSQDEIITVVIKGVNLSSPNNHIIFKGKKVNLSTNPSDRENTFLVKLNKADLFDPSGTSNTFEIVLYKRNKPYRYRKAFYVVPDQIATATFYYELPKTKIEYSQFYTTSKSATSGSSKTKDKYKTVNLVNRAQEGWIMDRSSIKCRKSYGNGDKHERRGPSNITDISFKMGATAKDGKAVCECTWREMRKVDYSDLEKLVVHLTFSDKNHAGSFPKGAIYKYTEIKFTGDREEESFVTKQDSFGPVEFSIIQENFTVKFKR